MDLKSELIAEHSRSLTLKIQDWVGNDQVRFDELMGLLLCDNRMLSQRSAWAVSHCIGEHPWLGNKWLSKMLRRMLQPVHDAVIRNILRSLRYMDLPEKYHAEIIDICFTFIKQKQRAAAIRAFAMHLLGKMCERYPELIPELKAIIETGMPVESPAFRSVGNKLMNEWHQLNRKRRTFSD